MVPDQELPPSPEQLASLRQSFLEMVKERGKDLFEDADVARFQIDDCYTEKFWIHGFFIPGPDRIRNTTVLAVEALLWRKEFGVADITEDRLDRALLDSGSLYSRGRDKQGGRLLILSVRRYVKDPKMTPKRKELLIYMLERIGREDGGKITIIFDCQSAGVRNVEIEAIQFIMQVLIHYYPDLVRRIIVLEMPWVMNTVWRLVKSLLPGPAQDMIKFCTKANVTEFLDTEGLPRELGGEDDWQYSWQPEQRHQPEISEDENRSWIVSPSDRLVFRAKADAGGELETNLTVSNRSTTAPLAYKVRSTRPALFLVSPSSGILIPGGLAEVRVRALVHGQAKLERERFQVAIVTNVREGEEIKAVFEDKNRVGREECILACEVERVRRTSTLETGTVEQANKQARVLSRKLSEMEDRMGQLRILLVAQCGLLLLAIAYFCISRGLNRAS